MWTWVRAAAAAAALTLAAGFVAPADAQTRASGARPEIYAVSGVVADVTGESAAAARPAAFAKAQRLAFARLVQRLTPAHQLAQAQTLNPTDAQLAALQAGIDIEDERASRTRYIGRFTVNFDPTAVRAYLKTVGVAPIETRGAATLVAPIFEGPAQEQWRQAWREGGFNRELAPIAVAEATPSGPPSWAAVEAAAAAAGAASAVYALARQSGELLTVELVEVGPFAPPRAWGEASVRHTAGAPGDAALRELALRANALIQDAWKQSLTTDAGKPTPLEATALFTTQREWMQIKQALRTAAATLVSNVRIEALTPRGAVVTFTYIGAPEQLAAVMRQNRVDIQVEGGTALLRPLGGAG
jgi:hypothetical protein